MASFVFERDWEENPPPRRRTATSKIPPGLPPADGHDPPQGWTPIRYECRYVRDLDGTPANVLLYSRPCPPGAARHQQHWPDATTAQQERRRRPSPEPHEVDGTTRVVCLAEMLSPDKIRDEEYYQDVLKEVTDEARKLGGLVKVLVPRPGVAGAGKVFLEYACVDDSIRCRIGMDGMWFDGNKVVAGYYPEDKFAAGDYDG